MGPAFMLTAADHHLLQLLAAGRTNAQIGQCMHRSEKTVRNQLTGLYAKLHVASRAEAVAVYLRSGLAHLAPVPGPADRDIRPIAKPVALR